MLAQDLCFHISDHHELIVFLLAGNTQTSHTPCDGHSVLPSLASHISLQFISAAHRCVQFPGTWRPASAAHSCVSLA